MDPWTIYLVALKEAKDILRFGAVWKAADLGCCTQKLCSGRHAMVTNNVGINDMGLLLLLLRLTQMIRR